MFYLNQCDPNIDYIHLAGRLFQEWICMAWVAVEDQKLKYQRDNQKALRADTYKNVREATEEKRRELAPRVDGMFTDDSQQPAVSRNLLSGSMV